jgi:MFS family permease
VKRARPWHWFLLYLPFGTTSGFVGVTLGYIAHEAKMDDKVVAGLVAMSLLPHTWKFFWAPIADITLSRKKWYALANALSCATVLVMSFVPFETKNLSTFKALIFINSLAISFLGMAVEGLMAHATPEPERGKAAGWFQAGNLGGYGIGGGLALLIAQQVSVSAAFVAVTIMLAACTLALTLVPDAPRDEVEGSLPRRVAVSVQNVFKDLFKTLFTSRGGIIALVLCFMPLGAGAAQGLFSAIASRWGASEHVVEIATGIVGGLVSAAGCLAGGWLSDRMSRRVAYAASGVILAAVAALMALAPQTVETYVVFTLVYQFAAGMVYGCFTGFVLEVIGVGAIATKYNALAALSNIPIWYMTLVDGDVSAKHGPVTMLFVDGASGIAGLVVLLIAIAIVRPGKAR